MDSLLKLTDDIVTAVDGITGHVMATMDGIFQEQHEHTNTDTRKSDESDTKTNQGPIVGTDAVA